MNHRISSRLTSIVDVSSSQFVLEDAPIVVNVLNHSPASGWDVVTAPGEAPEPPRTACRFLRVYLLIAVRAASIFAFTASRLKLAPFCIGGNSIAVIASFSTCC